MWWVGKGERAVDFALSKSEFCSCYFHGARAGTEDSDPALLFPGPGPGPRLRRLPVVTDWKPGVIRAPPSPRIGSLRLSMESVDLDASYLVVLLQEVPQTCKSISRTGVGSWRSVFVEYLSIPDYSADYRGRCIYPQLIPLMSLFTRWMICSDHS